MLDKTDYFAYDTESKRAAGRAWLHEISLRDGNDGIKPGKQLVFLCSYQPKERSFTRIARDSGYQLSDIVGIDDVQKKIDYNITQWGSGKDCPVWRYGMLDPEIDALIEEDNWDPRAVFHDGQSLPNTKGYVKSVARNMNKCGPNTAYIITVTLFSQYQGNWDGFRDQPGIKDGGRLEFLDRLREEMGSDLDRWLETEPLAGFYKGGTTTSRKPMAYYIFFSEGTPPPKSAPRPYAREFLKTPGDYEVLHRSVPKVANFFKSISEIENVGPRPDTQLWENQEKARAAYLKYFASSDTKGMIIEPPGAGKTLTESGAIVDYHEIYQGTLFVLLTHRIALSKQVTEEFHKLRPNGTNFDLVAVNSGDKQFLPCYEGDPSHLLVRPVTSVKEVRKAIAGATREKPVVLMTLYQSAGVVHEALEAEKRQLDLKVCDEFHKATSKNFNGIINPVLPPNAPGSLLLPSHKTLGFTATLRFSKKYKDRSMHNTDLYGEVIHRTTPMELQNRGRAVPVKFNIVPMDTNDIYDLGNITHPDKKEQRLQRDYFESIAGLKAVLRIKESRSMPGDEIRLLAFCENAHTQPKSFLESPWLQQEFPGYFVAYITAKACYYREPGWPVIRKATRESVLENVAEYPYSILFHYDTISEGINIPNLTDVFFGRSVAKDTMIHGIGRVQRLDPWDRERFGDGTIQILGNSDTAETQRPGWKKPYGGVWFLAKDLTDPENVKQFEKYIWAMTEAGEQYWVNDITRICDGKATKLQITVNPRHRIDPNLRFATEEYCKIAERAAQEAQEALEKYESLSRISFSRKAHVLTVEGLEEATAALEEALEQQAKDEALKRQTKTTRGNIVEVVGLVPAGRKRALKAWDTRRRNARKRALED